MRVADTGVRAAPFVRPVDVATCGYVGLLLVGAIAAGVRGGEPGAARSAGILAGTIGVMLLARALGAASRTPPAQLIAAWAPIGLAAVYWALNPIVDYVSPQVRDSAVIRLEEALFSGHVSMWAEAHLPRALNEALILSYFSFHFLLAGYGAVLCAIGKRDEFDRWTATLVAFFAINVTIFVFVPVTGPRLALADRYASAPEGLYFTDGLWRAYLDAPFMRDCLPSGHAGATLMLLLVSWRRTRWFFWAVLPVATGIIVATALLRFHYLVDLIAAVPLTFIGIALGARLSAAAARISPQPLVDTVTASRNTAAGSTRATA